MKILSTSERVGHAIGAVSILWCSISILNSWNLEITGPCVALYLAADAFIAAAKCWYGVGER